MSTWTPGATILACPLPACDWAYEPRQPGPEESDAALADIFGPGVFAATARSQRLQLDEEAVRAHCGSHDLLEWVTALTAAQDKLAAVRKVAGSLEPLRRMLLEILDGAT